MTRRLVVPTLAGAPPQNQSLGGFRVASCESRASVATGGWASQRPPQWAFVVAACRSRCDATVSMESRLTGLRGKRLRCGADAVTTAIIHRICE